MMVLPVIFPIIGFVTYIIYTNSGTLGTIQSALDHQRSHQNKISRHHKHLVRRLLLVSFRFLNLASFPSVNLVRSYGGYTCQGASCWSASGSSIWLPFLRSP